MEADVISLGPQNGALEGMRNSYPLDEDRRSRACSLLKLQRGWREPERAGREGGKALRVVECVL